jgi:sarcosine oxidase
MGAATAWWLARSGLAVTLLEQFDRGHTRGSSHGSSRIFRLAYPEVDYVRLAQMALPLWRVLEEESGKSLLHQTGAVDHGSLGELNLIAGALQQSDLPFEMLDASEARERWPGMRFDGPALFQPDGGWVNANATVGALQDQCVMRGGEVRFNERVENLVPNPDGVLVQTEAAEYRARVAVITCGAWITKVVGRLVSLPSIRITNEQPAHFEPFDESTSWPCFLFHEARDEAGPAHFGTYGLPSPGIGMKVAEHGTGPEVDPDHAEVVPDETRLDRLIRYVEEWFPGLHPKPVAVEQCLYTMTLTRDFILDRSGPLVIGSPCSGHGFKFTPVIGQILAELVMETRGPQARFRLRAS